MHASASLYRGPLHERWVLGAPVRSGLDARRRSRWGHLLRARTGFPICLYRYDFGARNSGAGEIKMRRGVEGELCELSCRFGVRAHRLSGVSLWEYVELCGVLSLRPRQDRGGQRLSGLVAIWAAIRPTIYHSVEVSAQTGEIPSSSLLFEHELR